MTQPSEEKEVSALIRVEGGTADEGILDLHDGAKTMLGIARAVNIASHAFANNDQIRTRADRAHGVQAFVHSSLKGCFEERIDIRFNATTIKRIGPSKLVNSFWDYLTCCWSAALGLSYTPETAYVEATLSRDPDFIHEIADALESAMRELQRPIESNDSVSITLARLRKGDLLTMNWQTRDFVTVRETKADKRIIRGNITRYNVLSDFGRLYSDEDGKVISFEIAKSSGNRVKKLVVNSMEKRIDGLTGKLQLKVSSIESAQGFVKRYVIHDATPIQGDD
ncbi:hypothetical protein [Burkholderia latens]|uniref:DUF7946 domain-containing protein n=1 Tax=Burkholderia latens TaxID=488446 RepID=UPI0012E359EE|nr:hypothetical protein [Burkholderia latens]